MREALGIARRIFDAHSVHLLGSACSCASRASSAPVFSRHFGARAHWGKNLYLLFVLQRAVGSYGARLDQMNEAVAELDPYGVFANSFAERAGIRWAKTSRSRSGAASARAA